MTATVIQFPRCRPPFLEIVAEAVDGYTHAVIWRDERYRPVVIWRGNSHAGAVKRISDHAPAVAGTPIVDRAVGGAA
jgi:hypothetical protein